MEELLQKEKTKNRENIFFLKNERNIANPHFHFLWETTRVEVQKKYSQLFFKH
jgi:hypothetical protein